MCLETPQQPLKRLFCFRPAEQRQPAVAPDGDLFELGPAQFAEAEIVVGAQQRVPLRFLLRPHRPDAHLT